jgi:hypothetical protein
VSVTLMGKAAKARLKKMADDAQAEIAAERAPLEAEVKTAPGRDRQAHSRPASHPRTGAAGPASAAWPAPHDEAALKAEHTAASTSGMRILTKPLPKEGRPHTAQLKTFAPMALTSAMTPFSPASLAPTAGLSLRYQKQKTS